MEEPSLKKRIISFSIKLLLIIIWLFAIFKFSSQNASDSLELSNKVLNKIVDIFEGKDITDKQRTSYIKRYTAFIRKSAHFFLYFVLGFLIFILLKDITKVNWFLMLITISLCFLYAISDEYHQSFVPGRTARGFDVLVDTSGSILSTGFLYIFYKEKEEKKYKKYVKNKLDELELKISILENENKYNYVDTKIEKVEKEIKKIKTNTTVIDRRTQRK